MLLKVRKEDPTLFILSFFLYITAPLVEFWRLNNQLSQGIYPTQADSIGLGFFFFLVGWFLSAPLIFGFVIWALWKCPAQIHIFSFNKKRPFWSWIWSGLFASVIFIFIFSALDDFYHFYCVEAIQEILLAGMMTMFRGIVVFRN